MDPLLNADFVSCPGWRSAALTPATAVHGTGRLVELGRLGVPKAEISLVTPCGSQGGPFTVMEVEIR